VVVGGGLAGLASCVGLSGQGLDVTLLESRPRLGGRASSFPDPATGELVDNCQHVSMACCVNLDEFCRRVGTHDLFRTVSRIAFLDEDGRESALESGLLPAPLHLSASFLGARYLTPAERLRVAWGLWRLGRTKHVSDAEPFAAWLRRHGQTERTIERFWATVLVSALNERLEQMDVGHARKVFFDGFLRHRRGYRMRVPTVPLGELYGSRLEGWLAEHGVRVRLKAGVRAVEFEDDGAVSGVTLRSGERLPADFVVLAVPFDRVRALLGPEVVSEIPRLDELDQMAASPITGIHLWFDRPVCPPDRDHFVIVGRRIQWVFNHSALQGREPENGGQYLQLVISAAYDFQGWDKFQIRDMALEDLRAIWPESERAELLRWWVVTEHGATFAVRPGVERLRPPQRTPIDGLLLAGDWTATGWPATMEGAVRSGYKAAEEIMSDLGRPTRLLRPDLPASWLTWLLFGTNSTAPMRQDARASVPAEAVVGD